jgi:hypothetical protein
MTITAKQIRGAVLSVRGARSAGIETTAAAAAPALLAEAESALERMLQAADRAAPSAPSMSAERRYAAAVHKAAAFAAAVEDLREELSQ